MDLSHVINYINTYDVLISHLKRNVFLLMYHTLPLVILLTCGILVSVFKSSVARLSVWTVGFRGSNSKLRNVLGKFLLELRCSQSNPWKTPNSKGEPVKLPQPGKSSPQSEYPGSGLLETKNYFGTYGTQFGFQLSMLHLKG